MTVDQNNKDEKQDMRWTQWLGLSGEFAGTLALFAYGGYKLDETFNTGPWCLIGGFFFALIGLLYLTIKRAMKDD